jgi:hypothetical protein
MDDTPESFAYRCLPLNIANAHGWEILNPCAFEAMWDGEPGVEAITIRTAPGAEPHRAPVSLFGQGVITFHVEGILRTPPGWNLWVGGSPNRAKDGISPLTGVIETDWSPFTFTMNWRFTRPGHWVRFDVMEPICFFFPVQRGAIEEFAPRFEPLDADPATMDRFTAWSRARDEFHRRMTVDPPPTPSAKWQKHYYQGIDVAGRSLVDDHRTKLRLRGFEAAAASGMSRPPADESPAPPQRQTTTDAEASLADELGALRLALAKREWLLEAIERQRDLAPALSVVERRSGVGSQEFLERYYAANRPVILTGELTGWPALSRWTPEYLKTVVGDRPVEFQGDRSASDKFEMFKDVHRRQASFSQFMDLISSPGAGNDAYLTAYNSAANAEALAPLRADIGGMDKYLDPAGGAPHGMMWIGPAGTLTSLHHDLTNNFIAQVVGRKSVKLLPAADVGKIYNHQHVFSEIADLDALGATASRYPRLAGLRSYDVVLEPGEVLFVPVGWWHQVKSLDFSVTITFTNFRWPNDLHLTYPLS